MKAMVLEELKRPLVLKDLPLPEPKKEEVLVKVLACGVCRTDLHIVDGELIPPHLPIVPGHQIVGEVVKVGKAVEGLHKGDRVGIPWLAGSCGKCFFCLRSEENLCDFALFTGYHTNGGFAEYCTADSRYVLSLPDFYSPTEMAPFLCAGLIGYRAVRMINDAQKIGLFGFGASAHLMAQILRFQKKEIYAFTRENDTEGQEFAKKLGAIWAGDSKTLPPLTLDAAIIFAPVGELVPFALKTLRKGGTVVCAGIHMSDIPSFPYQLLWEERVLRSVANLTREDGKEFFALAPKIPLRSEVSLYTLEETNQALSDLRNGRFKGAGVISLC